MIPRSFRRPARALRSSRFTPAARPVTPSYAAAEVLEDRTLLTVYVVDSLSDDAALTANTSDGILTLREAINAANSNSGTDDADPGEEEGDTISFASGLSGTITMQQGQFQITDELVINGSGITIDADGSAATNRRIFLVSGGDGTDLEISGLTLTGGFIGQGGAVSVRDGATLTAQNVTFRDNMAANVSGGGGALVIFAGSSATINGGSFVGNTAVTGGSNSGGAIRVSGGTLTVNGTSFRDNVATRAGGAIEVADGSTVTLNDVTGTSNDAGNEDNPGAPGNGGFLHVSGAGSTVTVSGGSITDNFAAAEGGGLWNDGGSTMSVLDVDILRNVAAGDDATNGGGGIFDDGGTLLVSGGRIRRNAATGTAGSGGGLFSAGGTVTLTDVSFQRNSAVRAGGGIEIALAEGGAGATVILNDVSLRRNVAGPGEDTPPSGPDFEDDPMNPAAPGNGGGLHVSAIGGSSMTTVTMTGGEAFQNVAAFQGGGLWNDANSTLTVNDVDIRGNQALGDQPDGLMVNAGGGGIYNRGGDVDVLGGRLNSNSALGETGSGGGAFTNGGTLDLSDVAMRANLGFRAGGAVEVAGEAMVTITDSTLDSNLAGTRGGGGDGAPGNGGALHVSGPGSNVSLDTVFVTGNRAQNEGGGLWNAADSTLTLLATRVEGNLALADGGGIYNQGGMVELMGEGQQRVRVRDNFTRNGDGGGLFNANSTMVGGGGAAGDIDYGSAFVARNSAAGDGGGAFAEAGTTNDVMDALFRDNDPNDFAGPGFDMSGGGGMMMV